MSIWVGNSDSSGSSDGSTSFESSEGLESNKVKVFSQSSHVDSQLLSANSAVRVDESESIMVSVLRETRVNKYNSNSATWSFEVILPGSSTISLESIRTVTFSSEEAGNSAVRIIDRTDVHASSIPLSDLDSRLDSLPISTTGSSAGELNSHLIPSATESYDIGSAERKIRHAFISDNSLWIGDTHKVSIDNGSVGFKKRKSSLVPEYLVGEGVDDAEAMGYFGVPSVSDITPHQWVEFSRDRMNDPLIGIETVFSSNDFESQQEDLSSPTLNAPVVNGGMTVSSTDIEETAFKVSIPGQDNMFCVDAKSSHDDRSRITIKTTNDFQAGDVPYLGYSRGLFHIERQGDANLPAITVWSHGGSASDVSGMNLCSWSTQENQGSYINLISNDGTFPSGYVPETKVLGRIAFGGYTNNQHRMSAHIEAKATENWSYGNKLGSKLIFKTAKKGTNIIQENLVVSGDGVMIQVPDAAPDTSIMNNSTIAMSVDEAQNSLVFTVKYSDGTVKTGTINLQ